MVTLKTLENKLKNEVELMIILGMIYHPYIYANKTAMPQNRILQAQQREYYGKQRVKGLPKGYPLANFHNSVVKCLRYC